MSKTFAKNSVINENFAEVPNLSVYYKSRADMSRSYQVNSAFAQSVSNSTTSVRNTIPSNSTAQLFDDEEEPKSKLSRYLGIAFLLALVILSITFLTFAIFYDEIFDDDDETAEEYWGRIQREIRLLQNRTRLELYNKTLMSALEANQSFSVSMSAPPPSKPSITLRHFIDQEFSPEPFKGKWISSNELLHYDDENNLCITNVENMNKTIVIPFNIIQRYHLSGLSLSPNRQYFLAKYNARSLYRYSSFAKYRIFSLKDSNISQPLTIPETPKDVIIQYADWGSVGSQLVFVTRNDIYYKPEANSTPMRLTKTGRFSVIFNGLPDWVYEEEIICEPNTFWLSPDGKNLVYASINDSKVDVMTWPYYGAKQEYAGVFNQYPKIQSVRYPKPGRPNPKVSLFFVPLSQVRLNNDTIYNSDSNAEELTLYLKPAQEIKILEDYYFTAFSWIDNDLFVINWMNRAQNFSVMTLYSGKNNFEPNTNFKLQSNNGWIDLFTAPLITPDRSSYLIKVPKMSDNNKEIFHHMARVSAISSNSEFMTGGSFEVKKLLGVNKEAEKIYFIGIFPGNPGEAHLMSVQLNRSNRVDPICHTCLMNKYNSDMHEPCLVSDATFSSGARYYILECKGPGIPRFEVRKTLDDSLVSTLENNEELHYKLKGLSLPKKIMLKVPVGKYDIDVILIVPESFAENSTRSYPIIFNVYGGPGSDTATVSHSYFYNEYSAFMASNQSVIYAYLDARGNPNHGCNFMNDVYRKIGLTEIEDVLGVARYLKKNKSYIDGDKVGIWGWSYGGYLATLALESDHDNSVFKCGVAVAPVSDWLYYDSVYVERYMGFPTPDDNLKNYQASSTLDKVKYLNGKQFLVMFGTADDNVHPINSMMLLKAMNEANIKYQTHIFPDNSHGLHNSQQYVYRRITDFFDQCFEQKIRRI